MFLLQGFQIGIFKDTSKIQVQEDLDKTVFFPPYGSLGVHGAIG